MAIPGNWLVGDPGHVDEHNRIYQNLASKAELANALDGLQYSAPVYIGDLPPEDQGVIWVDTSDDWFPFPKGDNVGDILAVQDPEEKLAVEWISGATYAKMESITVPIFNSLSVGGQVEPVDAMGFQVLSFAGDGVTDPILMLSPVRIPDNWAEYSIHIYWVNLESNNTLQNVMWRANRQSFTLGEALSSTPNESSGPSGQLTLDQYVVATTKLGGSYSVPSSPLTIVLRRLSTQDDFSGAVGLVALELRKEA